MTSNHFYELEDGAVVEFDSNDDIVPIGNGRGVPQRFVLTHAGGPSQPSFRFEFGVMNGIPVCVGVHIEAKPDIPVNTRDLTHNRIDNITMAAVGAVAWEFVEDNESGRSGWSKPGGSQSFNDANYEAGRAAVKSRPRNRRKRDDVDLERVAETVINAPQGAKTQSVMTIFICSRATAERYIRRAKDAGLIDD